MPQPRTLKVIEVFPSVQGEGLRLGEPTIFVRLSGCNLHCAFCDTKYARRGGDDCAPEEVIDLVLTIRRLFPCRWVCLTGGEPLLQDIGALTRGLKRKGLRVQVETNGTLRRPLTADWYSVSPKPPKFSVAPGLISKAREVKLIVTRPLSFRDVQKVRRKFPSKTPLLLQPQSNLDWSFRKGWVLVQRSLRAGLPNVRLTLQAHKVFKLP
jgi:organic radical activating enzyme